MRASRRSALPAESEQAFQNKVMQLAKFCGWRVYHTHDSRRSQPGFPDLTMVRERLLFAELKAQKGRVRPEQQVWIDALSDARQEVYLWRPSDWDSIVTILRSSNDKG